MDFSSAKGVLVVDPIEATNICIRKAAATVYCLFQIDNRVHRSQDTNYRVPSVPKWKEDSQCRFDIEPGLIPLLKIYVLQKTSGLPLVVGKAEVNLIDIFYEQKSDRWVKLAPTGLLNLEFTFYQAAPMLPKKAPSTQKASQRTKLTTDIPDQIRTEQPQAKVSSADKVFEDEKEERNRLRQLAKRVKRRYRESRASREFAMKEQMKKMTNDEFLYMEVNQRVEKKLPDVPATEEDEVVQIEENIPDISILSIDSDSLSQIELDKLPFSAESIGLDITKKLEVLKYEEEKSRIQEARKNYIPLSTEAFAVISRLERGNARPSDFKVEGGASEYKGDGTWNIGRLSDAAFTGDRPKLPPKIPYGMESEEYYMLHRQEFIEYFKTVS